MNNDVLMIKKATGSTPKSSQLYPRRGHYDTQSKIIHSTKPCLKKTKPKSKHMSKMHSAGEDTNLGAAGVKILFAQQQGGERETKKRGTEKIKSVTDDTFTVCLCFQWLSEQWNLQDNISQAVERGEVKVRGQRWVEFKAYYMEVSLLF